MFITRFPAQVIVLFLDDTDPPVVLNSNAPNPPQSLPKFNQPFPKLNQGFLNITLAIPNISQRFLDIEQGFNNIT